jgi:prepilin-type N-terminal cleavage/methylation domain-containing protein/prepilin-type processing-associated H-X9-DG protein
MNSAKPKTNNFTLIELLVVVSVIAILASLLLPSLGKSRQKARQAVCLSTQRQINTAILMYTDDNNYYPPNTINSTFLSGGQSIFWKQLIYSYLGINNEITDREGMASEKFFCPSSKIVSTVEWRKAGIGYNSKLGKMFSSNTSNHTIVAINDVSKPNETVIFADTLDDSTAWGQNFGLKRPSETPPPGSDYPIGNRHSNGINLVWVDGHGSWLRQVYLLSRIDDYDYLVDKP